MAPSVYPTGTTIYDPEKCWNGYTLYQSTLNQRPKSHGAVLVDMNGNIVNCWRGLDGFPQKMLPGGSIFGSTGVRNPKYGFQDMLDLVQVDWDGNFTWKFDRYQRIRDGRQKPRWMLRQHHDYQREGNPVGYYVPGMEPKVDSGNTLILCHKNLVEPKISDKLLLDDTIIEVTRDGKIIWEWICSEHFDEMEFGEDAKNALYRDPGIGMTFGKTGDWTHINSMSTLGPNQWYDGGDERFHPDNIIWDGRQTNIIAIIDKKTGKLVWKIGPDYSKTEELRKLGWIIGQHHAHLIPRGLPGEGNLLVFDNGGSAGYGNPNPGAPTGFGNARRDTSRVLEINPITLEIVNQYPPAGLRMGGPTLYSNFVSSAQRLPNGNTLITEGGPGRLLEITPENEIAWEYVNPYVNNLTHTNMIYRAYRVPYDWVPQVKKPEEHALPRTDNSKFHVPGAVIKRPQKVTRLKK
ncbi:MAG: aryl-sulfate sulfotransferase [Dehalococcoidia bacterium]|jgi:hypothetical protein